MECRLSGRACSSGRVGRGRTRPADENDGGRDSARASAPRARLTVRVNICARWFVVCRKAADCYCFMATSNNASGFGWILLAIVAGCLYLLFGTDWRLDSNQIAKYPLHCSEALKNGNCPPGWRQGIRTVYTVLRDSQSVIG